MKVNDKEYHDPNGDDWNDLNYGQGNPRYATGVWWLIPVALVAFAAWEMWGQ